MLRLYDKQQGDVDAVIAELDANKQITEQNQQALETARFEISEAQRTNTELVNQLEEANTAISNLQTTNQELVNEIETANIENKETFNNLINQTREIEAQ